MNKILILNEIKKYYGFKTDVAFAEYLGVKAGTLSSWYARNSIDYDLIIEKCVEIDANWLYSGTGKMIKEGYPDKQLNKFPGDEGPLVARKKKVRTDVVVEASTLAMLEKEMESLKKENESLKRENEALRGESDALKKMISLLESR